MQRRQFIQSLGLAPAISITASKAVSSHVGREVVLEPSRELPISGDADVIVAGAGPAGVAAAVCAARSGARVLLFEVHGCLGGVWTAGQLTWLFEMDKAGFAQEITAELDRRNARVGHHAERFAYAIEPMKLLLEEMCQQAGVAVQFFSRVVGAYKDKSNRLHTIVTESKSGRQAWRGKTFVDCTGDGDLGALAGCGFDMGKPTTGQTQPMTLYALVAVKKVDALKDYISFWQGDLSRRVAAVQKLIADLRTAGVDCSYGKPTLFHQSGNVLALMANHEYGVSAIDAAAITQATMNARREINTIVDALRSLGGPWEDMQLIASAEQIGVREGRRLHGLYTVLKNDLAEGRRHPDGICTVKFGVDIHSVDPNKGRAQEGSGIIVRPYQIPLRALIAKDVDGLLMAGRCISGDFFAHASYRVTGVAATTGQAAGVAAALAARQNMLPQDVDWELLREAIESMSSRS